MSRTVLVIPETLMEVLHDRHALESDHTRDPGYVRVAHPAPPEQVTMFTVGVSRIGDRLEVLGHRLVETQEGDVERSMCFARLSAELQYESFLAAREAGGLVTVHHHPGKEFFSGQDRVALAAMNHHLFQIAPGAVHLALIFGSGGLVGEVWEGPESVRPLDEVRIVGLHGLHRWVPGNPIGEEICRLDTELHDRTLRVYGREVMAVATRLRFGIISVGGLGSAVCDVLKYFGTDFVLVDPDRVERHNAARLAGYRHGDEGVPKTEVLRRAILDYNPRARVLCVNTAFPSPESIEAAKDCDILLCGPDADWVRYEVNRFAARYLKPAFFLGTEVKLDPEGERVRRIVGQVRFFVPGGLCCVCQGLDGVIHHPKVMEFGRRTGYVKQDAAAATPSIVTVNVAVANLAVTRLLHYLSGRPAATNLYYDEMDLRWDNISGLYQRRPECPFCAPRGIAGLGDGEPAALLEGGGLDESVVA